MRNSLHNKFLDKAKFALIASVEIYNKPSFPYREETFCLLALNAWELLLKAKILKDEKNNLRSIRVYETRQTKAGTQSSKEYLRKNRIGNPLTISLERCIHKINQVKTGNKISSEIISNITALTEVRDNAVHYINASPVLAKQVLEIASATIKNFILLAKYWFGMDFSDSLSLILPLSFLTGKKEVASVTVTADENRLISYLQKIAQSDVGSSSPYSVAISVQVKFDRSSLSTSSKVRISDDVDAVKIVLSEEDIRTNYPWDYQELIKRVTIRYSNFIRNKHFYILKKKLYEEPNIKKLVNTRYLDLNNPKSPKKEFYSPNVIQFFDKHYKVSSN